MALKKVLAVFDMPPDQLCLQVSGRNRQPSDVAPKRQIQIWKNRLNFRDHFGWQCVYGFRAKEKALGSDAIGKDDFVGIKQKVEVGDLAKRTVVKYTG